MHPAALFALGTHPVLADLDPPVLDEIAASLELVHFAAGAHLMTQGDAPTTFVLLTQGEVDVLRTDAGHERVIARLEPGAIVGELGLLGDQPRSASVVAVTDVTGFRGGPETLSRLVTTAQVREKIVRTAAARVAENVEPIVLRARDGSNVGLRPLIPSDRSVVRAGFYELSPHSRRQRFFSDADLSEALLDRLIDIDYVNHFAWIATAVDEAPERAVATARFVRLDTDPSTADLAFTVLDAYQARGIGPLLLGALIVAAHENGIVRFAADVLADNMAMRSVLNDVGAKWHFQGDVVHTVFDVPAGGVMLPDDHAVAQLRDAVRQVCDVAAP
jgi:protein lysine acetyltransferase